MIKFMRKVTCQVGAWLVAIAIVGSIGNYTAFAAEVSTGSGINAKTYTMADVADTPVALVANSGNYTINGTAYKATSMQGLNVGTTYAYVAKTESTTGINGSEAMICMWRIKLSNGNKESCVFKNEGASSYIEYSTSLGHANDVLVRKYAVGNDTSETNNIFQNKMLFNFIVNESYLEEQKKNIW